MPLYLFNPFVVAAAVRKSNCGALVPLLITTGVSIVSVFTIDAADEVEAFSLEPATPSSVLIEAENISLRSSNALRAGSLLEGMVEMSNRLSSGSGTVILGEYETESELLDWDADELMAEFTGLCSEDGVFKISSRYLSST